MSSTSSLKRPLSLTFFKSIGASSKKDSVMSLASLAQKIDATSGGTKADLPWIKLGRFGEQKTDKGSLRSNDNLKTIDGVEVDYDAGEITPRKAAELLKKADIAAVVYTSASHTPEHPKFRVLLPCSETLPKKERSKLVARVNGVLGGDIDGVSFTDSQSFYFGRVDFQDDHFQIYQNEGRFLDEAVELDATARGKRQRDKVDQDGNISTEKDGTRSADAWTYAKELIRENGTISDFEEWAVENPWKDYENNPTAAIERTWGRASVEVSREGGPRQEVEFDDLSDGEPVARKKKKEPTSIRVLFADLERLSQVPSLKMLFSNFISRGWLSGTFSSGGMGKSALGIAEAISMSTGIDFLGPKIVAEFDDETDDVIGKNPLECYNRFEPLKVLVLNFEDDNDTMRRRIAAIREYHGLWEEETARNLIFFGAEQQLNFSKSEKGQVVFNKQTFDAIEAIVQEHGIDVLVIDPFISTHIGSENDSSEMAASWGRFRQMATDQDIAVHLIDHMRKGAPGVDKTVDDARGSGAKIGIARFSRVLNRATKEMVEKLGLEHANRYIRIDDGKANHMAPSETAEWRYLASVESEMHEHSVVAVTRWEFPTEALEAIEAEAAQKASAAKEKGPSANEIREAAFNEIVERTVDALRQYSLTTAKTIFGTGDFRNATISIPEMNGPEAEQRRSRVKRRILGRTDIMRLSGGLFKFREDDPAYLEFIRNRDII